MTELQLRLWCLWMCDTFSRLGPMQSLYAAQEGASVDMAHMLEWEIDTRDSLLAWELSERMP